MRVPARIISPQSNGPVAGIVQDGLIASYLLTNTWLTGYTLVKKSVFMNCVVASNISMDRYNDLLKRAQKWYPEYISNTFELEDNIPGKLMFSILFPKDLYYERKTETSKEFPIVKIEEGVLVPTSGPVCKRIIGNKRGSLIHILWKEYSPDTVIDFISEVQFLTDHWLPSHGFSMGIADCQTTEFNKVTESLETIEIKIKKLKTKYKGEKLEEKIISLLNEAGNIGPQIAEKSMNKGERNALNIMRDSGAKGNIANTSSIVAFVGQQNIGGKRIPKTLSGGTRSLPRFEQGDTSSKASGFVSSRYIDGLDPHEVVYHAMAGREGVIATAITTAITGYIQKKISRKLEDHKIYYDGSVRDANERIIQFIYGDDGLDPQKLYGCSGIKFPFFANVKSIALKINKTLGKKTRKLKKGEIEIILEYMTAGAPGMQTSIVKNVTSIFQELLRGEFKKIELHESSIPDFCHRISELLETSKSQHGDAVGLIAAASIGEPTTQLCVRGETSVVIRKGNKIKQTQIGRLIDKLLENHEDVQELGKGSVGGRVENIHILTVDPMNEKTKWQKVTEISRHTSNGDLVKVTTKSGRSVTTTLSHSHLSRTTEGKIIPKIAAKLKIGDSIPVCKKMNSGILFDHFMIDKVKFDLDFENGWIFGAYLSEGNIGGKTQLKITNISTYFEQRVKNFALRYNGKYRRTTKVSKILPEYPEYHGTEHHVSGMPKIIRFILKHCKTGSLCKIVPGFAYFAPLKFVSGLLRGYFDGDGNVNASRQMIRVHSISRSLLEGIALLLSRFGIFGTFGLEKKDRKNPLHSYVLLRKYAKVFYEKIGSDFPKKCESLKEIILYNERPAYSRREDIDRIPEMGSEIAKIAKPLKLAGYSRNYKRWLKKKSIGRETLRKYLHIFENRSQELKIESNLSLIRQAVNNDIVWDEIVNIQHIPDPKEYVYDFGVDGNHTFMIANGIFVHNTLNFFHSTGHKGKDVSLGVPRFKEILNATESPKNPSCTIYFDDPILKKGTQIAKELESKLISDGDSRSIEALIKKNKARCIEILEEKRKKLEEIHINSFLKGYNLKYISSDVNPDTDCSPVKIITYKKYKKQWWTTLSEKLGEMPRIKPRYWVLEISLDIEKMCKKSYTTDEIANIIEEKGEGCLSCVSSPNNMGLIEIRTDFDEIRCFLKGKGHIMSDNTLNPKDLPHKLINTNLEFFLCRDSLVSFIKSICVGGLSKISHAYSVEDSETHEWVIQTRGSNFQAVLAFPSIDPINTVTNEIWEIYHTLGIEAARKFLIEETLQILSFDGTYINPRHIQLLIDSMTDTGTITNVNRNGISRNEGPIKKIMFEQPIDNIVEAAAFVENDELLSLPSSIMYGKIARTGTGMVSIQSMDKAPVQPISLSEKQ